MKKILPEKKILPYRNLQGIHSMKTIYLTRAFLPVVVTAHNPGDVYLPPEGGECRRVTASRLCLMGERLGLESDAFLRLMGAIGECATAGVYDGRAVDDWYGLVGLSPPAREEEELVRTVCRVCGGHYWGAYECRTICLDCLAGLTPRAGTKTAAAQNKNSFDYPAVVG